MGTIITDKPRVELFRDLVREGEERAHQPLDETLESYLVFTLIEHLRDPAIDTQPMAVALLDGLDQVGALREQRLRTVGDRCLLIAGFYPELARKRMVTPRYYAALGRHAYDELAAALRASLAELYLALSGAFDALVRVLAECRELPVAGRVPVRVARPELVLLAQRSARRH
jgi:hypothetical protein